MLTPRSLVLLGAFACLSLTAACGEDPGPVASDNLDGGTMQPVPDAATGSCSEGQSQACACSSGGAGTQTCYGGTWLLCNCNSYDAGMVSQAGTCLAGRYEGSFEGEYRSGFAFGFGIDVQAQDFSGQPGLAFTLNQQSAGCDSEFCDFTISDGYVKGTANGVFPFEGILTGTLDCNTKMFTGKMVGCYALGVDLGINVGHFEGPITGTYDGTTHEFTIGTWDVLEDADTGFFGMVGGNGSWNSKYNAMPTGAAPVGAPTCTGMVMPAPDAGTP